LLTHVPPVLGKAVIVASTHKVAEGTLTLRSVLTVTVVVVLVQPRPPVSVKVKVTSPADTPVINPLLSIVAMASLLLTHVPPVLGLAVIVVPTFRKDEGVLTVGAYTDIVDVVLLHPTVGVKVKVTSPADIPVINPLLSIVATPGALLTQVPPVFGLAVIVVPLQKIADDVLTIGAAATVRVVVFEAELPLPS
jgi:hypothetical protein